jgi:hypothetical protein
MKSERGGTLLGFIIGVVVGLASALVVAIYVTKVPVPFMQKAQSRTADQDADEAKKNKDWDPNAGLYGKNPAKAPVPAAPASAAQDGKLAKPEAKTDPKADSKAENKPAVSADPLGDLAKTRPLPAMQRMATSPISSSSVRSEPLRTQKPSVPSSRWPVSRPKCLPGSSRAARCTACAWGRLRNVTKLNGPRKSWRSPVMRPHWCGCKSKQQEYKQ